MVSSKLVRVSSDLDKTIKNIQKRIENSVGCKITYSEAGRVLSKMEKHKKFKVRIKGKGVVEISQL